MKKFLPIILSAVLLACVFTLSACDTINLQSMLHDITSHEFGEWITVKAATCTEAGEQKRSCECGKTDSQSIEPMGHTEVIDAAVAPSCTQTGLTEGKHCSTCDQVLVARKSVPMTDHEYVNMYKCRCGLYLDSAKIVILSQNVRYRDDGDGKDISDRAPRFKLLVEKYKPDIIGTQETTAAWNQYFDEYFSEEYGTVGCSRDGKDATTGEWSLILYRLDRFELLDSGDFWLSSTPQDVSKVNGSVCYRICTWAILKDKNTGKTFVMSNTHLDHTTDDIRIQQLGFLLAELSALIKEYPVYLTGDFNSDPSSPVYRAATSLFSDTRIEAAENKSTINHTFDSYGTIDNASIIDYCFYNDRSEALSYLIANDQFDGYVSDHYGVLSEMIIK